MTKGIHSLLLPPADRPGHLPRDRGRANDLAIPWREFSLVGTTDTDFTDSPDRAWATRRRGPATSWTRPA